MQRILIVDDTVDIANSLKFGLERLGFAVDAFTDPELALNSYKPSMYDLLIIDVRMPKMSGFELANSIKNKDSSALVWFLTAFEVYQDEIKKSFPGLAETNILRKPISLKELSTKIKSQFGQVVP